MTGGCSSITSYDSPGSSALLGVDSHVGPGEGQARLADGPVAGFNIDRNGKRRKPVWINIVTLGILLPGFAIWGLFRAFTTPTGIGLWALAAARCTCSRCLA